MVNNPMECMMSSFRMMTLNSLPTRQRPIHTLSLATRQMIFSGIQQRRATAQGTERSICSWGDDVRRHHYVLVLSPALRDGCQSGVLFLVLPQYFWWQEEGSRSSQFEVPQFVGAPSGAEVGQVMVTSCLDQGSGQVEVDACSRPAVGKVGYLGLQGCCGVLCALVNIAGFFVSVHSWR